MDKLKVYQKILDIAIQLQKDGSRYTRADLAYDLRDLGVMKDCFEVGLLVFEAYQHFKEDEAIQASFYDNDNKEDLVSEYQVNYLIENNDDNTLFPLLKDKLATSSDLLSSTNRMLAETMNDAIVSNDFNLLNTVVGTQGIANVKNEASAIYNGYSSLVGNYEDAKQSIKSIIADFVKLRGQICDVYRQYAMILVDAFGDSIKAINPELFDFDSIEWLDVQSMLKQVSLDYNKIVGKCPVLMSDITDSFTQSLQAASNSYRNVGSKQAGLALAALGMISHYTDVAQKTAELKQDLVVFKNTVKHDVTLIKGDLGRLLVIYKTLNDLYIPKSEVFCRFSKQVLTTEWKQLEEALYNDAEVRELKQRRDELLAESKEVEKEMLDAETNVGYYTVRIEGNNQSLESLRSQYEQAKSSKPSKPFFLMNIFTFGASGKKYNRAIYDWNKACKPVITQFEGLQVDVKLDSEELSLQQTELENSQKRHEELKHELVRQNKLIANSLKVNPELQLKMLPHLEAMVKLLRLAREIANSKLDQKLTKKVSISEVKNIELSPETQQNIHAFAQVIKDQVSISPESLPNEEMENETVDGANSKQRVSDEELSQVMLAGNEAVQKTVDLLESWTNLQMLQNQYSNASKTYDEELSKLQNEFRKNLSEIDDKSAILRESLRRINTAQNHEQLKEGLLSLAGKEGDTFTEKDWEEFFNGNKTIEL